MTAQSRNLKTHNIVFLVVAAAAPLTVVSAGVTAAYAASGMAGVPLGYLLCGALVALFAVGFCAMAKEIPNTAAFFSYVSAGLGRSHGLAASWLAIVSYTAMQIALYCLLGYTAASLISTVAGVHWPWWLFSFAALGLVALLGLKSADFASRILGVLLACEFTAVMFFCFLALRNPADSLGVQTFTPQQLIGAGTGTLLAFTIAGFMGIESSAMYSEEAVNPSNTIPRATLISVSIISAFYGFSSWCIAQSTGESHVVEQAQTYGSDLFFNFIGERGFLYLVPVIQSLLVTSLFAATTAFHNSISRYLMALGREEVIWKRLGVTKGSGAPVAASLFQSAFGVLVLLAAVLAQLLTGFDESFPATVVFSWMSNAGGFGLVFLLLVTSISVVLYFRKTLNAYSCFVTVVAPALAIAGFGTMFVLILTNFSNLIGDAQLWYLVFIIPSIILSCGVAGYARGEYLKRHRPEVYCNIGSGRPPVITDLLVIEDTARAKR
ncbi:APC family permease [Corynebacterium lizhenjunii]|uniref:APC family permease n=1 Tax=Corynebacterium lizhenjunii TaxID=2709394 RepID=A0A7T0KDV1_9CORY|nr:APC family permease [Corynebacterium lizhenjunii]QPK78772.1 APC family permease [Corynebacterium lizhenjunii]